MSNVRNIAMIRNATSFDATETDSFIDNEMQDFAQKVDEEIEVDAKALSVTSYNLKVIQGPSKSYASPITNEYFSTSYDLLPKIGASTNAEMQGYINSLNRIALVDSEKSTYTYLANKKNKETQLSDTKSKVKYSNQFIRPKQKRRLLVQPKLVKLLHFAYLITAKEYKNLGHVEIYSGGQAALYDSGKKFTRLKGINSRGSFPSRVSSTTIRHDKGYSADIYLRSTKGKIFSLRREADFNLIRTFIRNCYALGAGGIGAHPEYQSGTGIHVDIARLNPEINDTTANNPYRSLNDIDERTKKLLAAEVANPKTASTLEGLIQSKINVTLTSRAWGKKSSARAGNLAQWLKELKDEHALK